MLFLKYFFLYVLSCPVSILNIQSSHKTFLSWFLIEIQKHIKSVEIADQNILRVQRFSCNFYHGFYHFHFFRLLFSYVGFFTEKSSVPCVLANPDQFLFPNCTIPAHSVNHVPQMAKSAHRGTRILKREYSWWKEKTGYQKEAGTEKITKRKDQKIIVEIHRLSRPSSMH